MAKHTFHLTPHASSRLYQFISSPILRLIQFCLTLLAILFFSIGVGLASKYVKPYPYWDLGIHNDFCEKLALGMMFLPFVWIAFLLVWYVLKKPEIHPGYYIGFDLYVGLSHLILILVLFMFSAYILDSANQVCAGSSHRKEVEVCDQHVPLIKLVYITAYAFAWIVALMHWIFFGVACRVCDVYDREKKANKKLEKKGVVLESRSRSSSQEHIV
ncbi:MAG: hypothetical protein L6R38_000448 [Xanthoria sp. 2 TBL-2021]|nr:MAG: hypothetical protein L6R38_000448 [Xanthoria sp. 2 TBL-2021]